MDSKHNLLSLAVAAALTFTGVSASAAPVFSLDIGSDTEISDPARDAGELADPGDMYQSNPVAGSLLGTAPVLDDANMFGGTDPAPAQGDIASAAPIGTPGLSSNFFDIDGYDALSARLYQFDISPQEPLNQPVLRQNLPIDCIYAPDYIALSYSDDSAAPWGATLPPRIPVEGLSPLGFLYGTTTGQDEAFGINIDVTGGLPATLLGFANFRDEETMHVDLGPNPTLGSIENDDDIDALDHDVVAGCNVHYFSVDSEARMSLDPGIIYWQSGAGAPNVALQPFHFGLPGGVNIDAFEFTWLPTPSGAALAVLYSVQPDVPATAVDESGGATPSTIYGSFLTGTSFIVLGGPANGFDNVDALAVYTPDPVDSDGDGIDDSVDNCTNVPNPGQRDTDGDGIGNICDQDLNQDCIVSFPDLALFRARFGTTDPDADFNGDGNVNFADLLILRESFFDAPGPAAEPNLCAP